MELTLLRRNLLALYTDIINETFNDSKPPVKYVLQNREISPDSVRFVQIRLRVGTNSIKLYQFGTNLF